MSATDQAASADGDAGRIAGVLHAARTFARVYRKAQSGKAAAAFAAGYCLGRIDAIATNGNGVDPALVQAVRNETRFLLGAYLERGEA